MIDDPYDRLLIEVRTKGEVRTDRTGTGTLSVFAPDPLRYPLGNRTLALITSKQVAWRMALREYMWMLSGSTDVNELRKSSHAMAAIWSNWADEYGDIGPTYGAQYRNSGGAVIPQDRNWDEFQTGRPHPQTGVDQLSRVVHLLAEKPDTRRALISLWGAAELDDMGIEPCMTSFQFSLRGEHLDELDLHVYQRSADLMLGVPFDLFQASLLAHLVARELTFMTGRHITAGELTWSAGDAHIYLNHIEAADLQIKQAYQAPAARAKLIVPATDSLRLLDNTLTAAHIDVEGYHAAPRISAGEIAV